MKKTIDKSEFVRAFDDYNRSNNFSVAGRESLFDYLEDVDENMELDVIAICCEFTEYENFAEFQADYGDEYESIDNIEDVTLVIRIDDESFIIQGF